MCRKWERPLVEPARMVHVKGPWWLLQRMGIFFPVINQQSKKQWKDLSRILDNPFYSPTIGLLFTTAPTPADVLTPRRIMTDVTSIKPGLPLILIPFKIDGKKISNKIMYCRVISHIVVHVPDHINFNKYIQVMVISYEKLQVITWQGAGRNWHKYKAWAQLSITLDSSHDNLCNADFN